MSDHFSSERRDAVVVGAGITGLTTAVLLARAGLAVTVLEAREVGAVTTGNTTGKLSLLQGTTFSQLRRHTDDDVLRAYGEANREGQAWLARQLEIWGLNVERCPAYTYVLSAEARNLLEQERDASAIAGITVEEVNEIGLPFETAGALRLDDQVQLQPMTVLAEFARELHDRGGKIVEYCRVRDVIESDTVEAGNSDLEVVTHQGTLRAEYCVLATGTPILDRSLFFARLKPSRSFAAAYELPAAPPEGMYVSADEPGRSLRTADAPQGRAPLLVVGGGAHLTGRDGDTRDTIAELDGWVGDNFGLSSRRVTWWGAQDYRSLTRLPFAGRLPRSKGAIYTATAYNKWGMTNGIAAALTITADILGGNLEWAHTLREQSLKLATVRDAIDTSAAVAARLVSGWAAAELRSITAMPQLEEGDGTVVRDGLAPVGIARVGDRTCRVSAVCTHMGGVLKWNAAETSWDCPLHGSRFAATGELLEGPAVTDLEIVEPPGDDAGD